ncbi:hypothetical protein PCL_09948 [Purpureocillium lilacinum]|uniref:Uncharacterized protein n=1 Tax=Purpureocillium lilacinum TaxID=33203 RepID=A0A2U3EEQ2_PURLI|nr:hypothetical protein PCL_09948 [Purpureocillium lilacinum]
MLAPVQVQWSTALAPHRTAPAPQAERAKRQQRQRGRQSASRSDQTPVGQQRITDNNHHRKPKTEILISRAPSRAAALPERRMQARSNTIGEAPPPRGSSRIASPPVVTITRSSISRARRVRDLGSPSGKYVPKAASPLKACSWRCGNRHADAGLGLTPVPQREALGVLGGSKRLGAKRNCIPLPRRRRASARNDLSVGAIQAVGGRRLTRNTSRHTRHTASCGNSLTKAQDENKRPAKALTAATCIRTSVPCIQTMLVMRAELN